MVEVDAALVEDAIACGPRTDVEHGMRGRAAVEALLRRGLARLTEERRALEELREEVEKARRKLVELGCKSPPERQAVLSNEIESLVSRERCRRTTESSATRSGMRKLGQELFAKSVAAKCEREQVEGALRGQVRDAVAGYLLGREVAYNEVAVTVRPPEAPPGLDE